MYAVGAPRGQRSGAVGQARLGAGPSSARRLRDRAAWHWQRHWEWESRRGGGQWACVVGLGPGGLDLNGPALGLTGSGSDFLGVEDASLQILAASAAGGAAGALPAGLGASGVPPTPAGFTAGGAPEAAPGAVAPGTAPPGAVPGVSSRWCTEHSGHGWFVGESGRGRWRSTGPHAAGRGCHCGRNKGSISCARGPRGSREELEAERALGSQAVPGGAATWPWFVPGSFSGPNQKPQGGGESEKLSALESFLAFSTEG